MTISASMRSTAFWGISAPYKNSDATATIPAPQLWYKNSSIASLSNGTNISTWLNSGSYGAPYNLTSGSGLGAAVPTKQVDSGSAAAYFDGSKFLRFSGQSNITFFPTNDFKRWTIFVVYRDGNGTGNFGFLGRYGADGTNGSIGMWPNGQGNFNQVHTNDGFPVNFAMSADETKLQRGLRWGTPTSNDGTITYWDGTSGTSSTSWSVYGSDLQVGGIGTARTTYNNGYLYELILYERALSDTEITTVRTYLNSIVVEIGPAPTLPSGTITYTAGQSFDVSSGTGTFYAAAGVTSIKIEISGGAGGGGGGWNAPGAGGGAGGITAGIYNLSASRTFTYYVGNGGSRGAGYASPGHGGGASAVVIYDTFTAIAAAGGGGGGGDGWNGTAGTGGAGGSATSQAGPYIGNGANGTTTQSAGGGGGTSSAGTNGASSLANAVGRTGGKGGRLGGSGGGGASGYGEGGSFSTDYYWAGGGGGGGYTGGAGGWGSSAGDGGGGGSSYLATGISSTTASFSGPPATSGGAAGNGQYNAGTSGSQGRVKVTFI